VKLRRQRSRCHSYSLACLTVLMSAWLRIRYGRAVLRRGQSSEQHVDERAIRYAGKLLAEAREELKRVDTKASILLAGVGVATGAVAGTIVTRGWTPFRLPFGQAVVWWAGAAAISAGSAVLLAAVYPRRRRPLGGSDGERDRYIGYYADVADSRSAADVAAIIRQSAARELELMAEQLLQVSLIVDRKYSLMRWAMWMLAAGVSANIVVVLVNVS
jgi:pycsar effector protein